MVKVGAAAPVRLTAIRLEPMRGKSGKVLQIMGDYPDCVGAVKILATVKQANHDYFGVIITRC